MWDRKLQFVVIDDDMGDTVLLRINLEKVPGLKFDLRAYTDPESCPGR